MSRLSIPVTGCLLFCAWLCTVEGNEWPRWDGQELMENYAKRAGLELRKKIHVGSDVELELVLVPSGSFKMGQSLPDWSDLEHDICVGKSLLLEGVGYLLTLIGLTLLAAWRNGHRLQVSLGRLVSLTAATGAALIGWLQWQQAEVNVLRATVAVQESALPQHDVAFARPWYMGAFEITRRQYLTVMCDDPVQSSDLELPVNDLLWDDAREFCRRLSERTGLRVRLPSEAEWEYAAVMGSSAVFGQEELDGMAWYGGTEREPHEVGQKRSNHFGLYDILGNVPEWVEDDWHPNYRGAPPDGSAWVTEWGHEHLHNDQQRWRLRGSCTNKVRVARGGGWSSPWSECHPALRTVPLATAGFRVVVELGP